MNKLFATLTAILLLSAVPLTQADEHDDSVVNEEYISTGAWALGNGNAVTLCPDVVFIVTDPNFVPWATDLPPYEEELEEEYGCPNEDPRIPHTGGATMFAETNRTYLSISAKDDVFTLAGMTICMWNDDADPEKGATNACSHDDHAVSGMSCEELELEAKTNEGDKPFGSSRATAWIFNAMVTDDNDICFGTTGVVEGSFTE